MKKYLVAKAEIRGAYRYSLTRRWAKGGDKLVWVMLNPSTADGEQDDPTIRRCVGFAKQWGYNAIVVVNLYAFRATNPAELKKADNPVGMLNNLVLQFAVEGRDVMLAWGAHAPKDRADEVISLIQFKAGIMYTLGQTKSGQPRHPLMFPYTTSREEF